MAKQEVVIEVSANSGQAISSLKELKKELKAAQDAALNGDGKAAQRVADLKDKIDDLKDSTKSLQGSGIERAESSFRLLGEGFKNLDFEKVKIGLGGLKTALAATGVMLVVQGISYLVENFDELSKGSGLLAKALRGVGEVLSWIKDAVYSVTDAIGLTNSELDKQGEAIKENSDKTKEALASQVGAFDRQLKVAQAAGKSTIEIEKAKQQAIMDTNLQVVKQIEAYVRAGGELDEEKKRILTASLEAIKNAKAEQTAVELKSEKEKNDKLLEANRKYWEDKRKDDEKAYKDWLNFLYNAMDTNEKATTELAKQGLLDREEVNKQSLNGLNSFLQQQKAIRDADSLAEMTDEELKAARKLKIHQDLERNKQAITQTSIQAAQALSEAFFAFQLRAANGNAAKELEVKKRQFQVDKAFRVAQAIQDGISATMKAFAQGGGFPAGLALSIPTGIIAAANVAKILATKFDGGSVSGSTGDIGGGGGVALNAPNIPQINNASNQPTTQLSNTGQNLSQQAPIVKAVVVETDITNSQNRVNKLTEQAMF